jgi:tetratricopeptide (TPR) repeat protein
VGEVRGLLEQYEELRKSVNIEIDVNKNYGKAIKILMNYLKIIKKYEKQFVKDDIWFVYYNIGLINKKNNNTKEALKYAKLSIKFYTEDNQYIKSIWLLATCYELTINNNHIDKDKIKKINRIYGRCSTFYRMSDIKDRRIIIMFNMAKLKKSTKHMLKLVTILLDELDMEETPITYNQSLISVKLLESTCIELIDMCIELNEIEMIFKTVSLIKIKTVKETILGHLRSNKIFAI